MLFSSLEFLFFFFPIVIIGNYILPRNARNYWLLAASLFFYAWGEPTFFFLLIVSILVNYSLGLLLSKLTVLEKNTSQEGQNPDIHSERPDSDKLGKISERFYSKKTIGRSRTTLFIILLLLNFSALFVTKYLNFITSCLRTWFPIWEGAIPQTSFVLPLSISFYTFQSVSYIIDIYRGMPAETNPCFYGLFITFFPQLLQGPIIRYGNFRPQLQNRIIYSDIFSEGVIRFLTGFNQKVLLANILSEVADAAFAAKSLSVGMAWLGMLAYSLQLYFDFAGYSDMAVGLGLMFGFRLSENFNFPYASTSITEFWRRWHISLGSWFRDYLYFPLGGSRVKTKSRVALNLAVVWIATGIWHGADWTFILWGCLHGIFVIMEKLTDLPKKLKDNSILRWFYRGVVLFVAMYAWMLFRAVDFSQAVFYTKSLFKLNGNAWRDSLFIFNSREYIVTLVLAVICAFPFVRMLRNYINSHKQNVAGFVRFVWFVIQMVLAVVSLSSIVMSTHNPFLYTNF